MIAEEVTAPKLLQWVVESALPPDTVAVVVERMSRQRVFQSKGFDEMLLLYTAEDITSAITDLLTNTSGDVAASSTMECVLGLKSPNYRQKFLSEDYVGYTLSSNPVPGFESQFTLITFQPSKRYSEILHRLQLIEFTVEQLPFGVCLYRVSRTTSSSLGLSYYSRKYMELMRATPELVQDPNLEVMWNRIPIAERTVIHGHILRGIQTFSEYSFIMRQRLEHPPGEQEELWYKISANCVDGGESCTDAALVIEPLSQKEDGTAAAMAMTKAATELTSLYLLSSFTGALFDLTVLLDSNFRFVDDSPKLRHFLLFSESDNVTLKGTSLETLMVSEHERMLFREFMAKSLETRAKGSVMGSQTPPAASMVRLKISFHGRIVDVDMYASPTYYRQAVSNVLRLNIGTSNITVSPMVDLPAATTASGEAASSPIDMLATMLTSGNDSGALISGYLLGIRVHQQGVDHPSQMTSSPIPPTTQLSTTAGETRSAQNWYPPDPSVHPSDAADELFAPPPQIPTTTPATSSTAPHLSHALTPAYCFRRLTEDFYLAISPAHFPSPHVDTLLTPEFRVSDSISVRDELLCLIPGTLQAEFVRAYARSDYKVCSQFVRTYVWNKANIAHAPSRSSAITAGKSADLVRCVYRFHLSLLDRVQDGETSQQMLRGISELLHGHAGVAMGEGLAEVSRIELALALTTAAIRFPESFIDAASTQWLRQTFVAAVASKVGSMSGPTAREEKSRRLPFVYWVCVLWGSLQVTLGRWKEARSIIESAVQDMRQFVVGFPECAAVRQIQSIALHNLILVDGHLGADVSDWCVQLEEIADTVEVIIPQRCIDLLQRSRGTASATTRGGDSSRT